MRISSCNAKTEPPWKVARAAAKRAAASAQRAIELARLRFEEGLDDYLDVLEAQRTLLTAEDQLAESRLQSSSRAIAAYRALGGIEMPNQYGTEPAIALE